MKKVFFILIIILSLNSTSVFSFFNNQSFLHNKTKAEIEYVLFQNSDIIDALKEGNSGKFSRYFNEVISMKFPNTEEMRSVSKNQANMNIKMFFQDNNISSFALSSQRELGTTRYIAGKLIGSKDFNITVMIKSDNGKDSIVSVRIN